MWVPAEAINSLSNPASSRASVSPSVTWRWPYRSGQHQATLEFQVKEFETRKTLCEVFPSLPLGTFNIRFYQDGEDAGRSCLQWTYCVPSTVPCS